MKQDGSDIKTIIREGKGGSIFVESLQIMKRKMVKKGLKYTRRLSVGLKRTKNQC